MTIHEKISAINKKLLYQKVSLKDKYQDFEESFSTYTRILLKDIWKYSDKIPQMNPFPEESDDGSYYYFVNLPILEKIEKRLCTSVNNSTTIFYIQKDIVPSQYGENYNQKLYYKNNSTYTEINPDIWHIETDNGYIVFTDTPPTEVTTTNLYVSCVAYIGGRITETETIDTENPLYRGQQGLNGFQGFIGTQSTDAIHFYDGYQNAIYKGGTIIRSGSHNYVAKQETPNIIPHSDWLQLTESVTLGTNFSSDCYFVSPSYTNNQQNYFDTIQKAIDACDGDNSIIFVNDGTYIENLTIDQKSNVTIIFSENSVIQHQPQIGQIIPKFVYVSQSTNINIKNGTFKTLNFTTPVFYSSYSTLNIENSIINNNDYSVSFRIRSSDLTLNKVRVSNFLSHFIDSYVKFKNINYTVYNSTKININTSKVLIENCILNNNSNIDLFNIFYNYVPNTYSPILEIKNSNIGNMLFSEYYDTTEVPNISITNSFISLLGISINSNPRGIIIMDTDNFYMKYTISPTSIFDSGYFTSRQNIYPYILDLNSIDDFQYPNI